MLSGFAKSGILDRIKSRCIHPEELKELTNLGFINELIRAGYKKELIHAGLGEEVNKSINGKGEGIIVIFSSPEDLIDSYVTFHER